MSLQRVLAAILVTAYLVAGPLALGGNSVGASGAGLQTAVGAVVLPVPLQVAPDTRPLGDRAWDVARFLAVDIGSRPAGSDEERQAAAYLARQYGDMGYVVDIPPFDFNARGSSGTSQNVVARSRTESPTAPIVVIGGHYDSVPAGPGANDNASGTATVVEIARDLAATPAPQLAVRFVAFGAEEIGLLGSKEYVRTLSDPDRARIKLFINLDMLAVGDQPQFAGSGDWVAEAMARAASQGYSPRDITDGARGLSDHQTFIDAGIPSVMFHAEEDNAYHTARDVIERVQPDLLDLMGNIALGLVRVASG